MYVGTRMKIGIYIFFAVTLCDIDELRYNDH